MLHQDLSIYLYFNSFYSWKRSGIIDMFQNQKIAFVILVSIHIHVYDISWVPIKYEVVEILHVVILYLLTKRRQRELFEKLMLKLL